MTDQIMGKVAQTMSEAWSLWDRCPKWIRGTPSEDHEFLRISAQTRTWEPAEAKTPTA